MNVKTHPLGDILSKKLFGIETVPKAEQTKMVRRAIKAAIKHHDEEKVKGTTRDGKRVVPGNTVWVKGSTGYHKTTVRKPEPELITEYYYFGEIPVSESFTTKKAIKAFNEGKKK